MGSAIRPDGSFTLTGITPGDYTLRVGMPGMDDGAFANVTVTDGDVNEVQLVATKASPLRGRVLVDEGATPPTPSTLRLFLSSPEPIFYNSQATVKDDYTFEMKAHAGHFTIRMFAEENERWHLHAVRLHGLDVTDSGFDVPANGGIVIWRSRSRRPTGAVSRCWTTTTPVRDAWVVIFAQDPQRWSTPTRFVSAGRPNLNNVYRGAPAAFRRRADRRRAGRGTIRLSTVRDRATRVTVADGANTTVDPVVEVNMMRHHVDERSTAGHAEIAE